MTGRVFRIAPARPDASEPAEPSPDGRRVPASRSRKLPPTDDLLAQRAALERRIARAEEAERRAQEKRRQIALERIRALMAMWHISVADLRQAQREPAGAPTAEATRPPKYVHPKTGESWDGTGTHPDWLRRALLKEGYTVAELAQAARDGAPVAASAASA